MAERHHVILDLNDVTQLLQFGHQIFTRLEAILPGIRTSLGGHLAIEANYLYTRQVVANTNLKVGGIMSRRDFDCPRTKTGIHRFVSHDRYLTTNHRQDCQAPDKSLVTWVLGIDRYSSIAKNGFRARCSHADILSGLMLFASFRLQWVAHIGQRPRSIHMVDFQVRKGAHTARAPVDDALATIDQPLFIERHEGFTHSLRQSFIKGKALPRPVT